MFANVEYPRTNYATKIPDWFPYHNVLNTPNGPHALQSQPDATRHESSSWHQVDRPHRWGMPVLQASC